MSYTPVLSNEQVKRGPAILGHSVLFQSNNSVLATSEAPWREQTLQQSLPAGLQYSPSAPHPSVQCLGIMEGQHPGASVGSWFFGGIVGATGAVVVG